MTDVKTFITNNGNDIIGNHFLIDGVECILTNKGNMEGVSYWTFEKIGYGSYIDIFDNDIDMYEISLIEVK